MLRNTMNYTETPKRHRKQKKKTTFSSHKSLNFQSCIPGKQERWQKLVNLNELNSVRTKSIAADYISESDLNERDLHNQSFKLKTLLKQKIDNKSNNQSVRSFNSENKSENKNDQISSNDLPVAKSFKKFSKKELHRRRSSFANKAIDKEEMLQEDSNKGLQDDKILSVAASRKLEKRENLHDSMMDSGDDSDTDYRKLFISPESKFAFFLKRTANLLSLIMIFVYPLNMVFPTTMMESLALNFLIEGFFIIDFFLHFLIGYIDSEDNLVTKRRRIAINYLSSWFVVDFLAAIPTGLINCYFFYCEKEISSKMLLNKTLRFFRIIDYIKNTKLRSFSFSFLTTENQDAKEVQVYKAVSGNSSLVILTKFLVCFLISSHIFSCTWMLIRLNKQHYWIDDLSFNLSNYDSYVEAQYFVWTSVLTVGYGDIHPVNTAERLFTFVMLTIGIGIYSFFISFIGDLITKSDSLKEKYTKKMRYLQEAKQKFKLPEDLYSKTEAYIKYEFKSNRKDRFGFITDLPTKLRQNLIFSMYHDFINNCNFLRGKSKDFCCDIIMHLQFMTVSKNETIIEVGDKVEEMVFVSSGKLAIILGVKHQNKKVINIHQYEFFGDIICLSNQRSPITLKCRVKKANLMFLKKADLEMISLNYPLQFEKNFRTSSYNYSVLLDRIEEKIKAIEAPSEEEQIKPEKKPKVLKESKQIVEVKLQAIEVKPVEFQPNKQIKESKIKSSLSFNKEHKLLNRSTSMLFDKKNDRSIFMPSKFGSPNRFNNQYRRSDIVLGNLNNQLKIKQLMKNDVNSFFDANITKALEKEKQRMKSNKHQKLLNMLADLRND